MLGIEASTWICLYWAARIIDLKPAIPWSTGLDTSCLGKVLTAGTFSSKTSLRADARDILPVRSRFGHCGEHDKGGCDHRNFSSLADLNSTPIIDSYHFYTQSQDADTILQTCPEPPECFQGCSSTSHHRPLAFNPVFPLDHSYSQNWLFQTP